MARPLLCGLRMTRVMLFLAACLALISACSSVPRGGSTESATSRPADNDDILPMHEHMQEHFVRTDLMQKALVAGDLDRVRREATTLLKKPEPAGMPAAWTPFLLQLMEAASEVSGATRTEDLAAGVGRMGASCGACHQGLGISLNLRWPKPPRETIDPRIRMARHQWATERLWDSLVSADDSGWYAAATVLREDPLLSEDLTAQERIDPHVQLLADRVQDMGQQAEKTVALSERIQLFGQIMSTCADCHHAVGKGPRSPPEL